MAWPSGTKASTTNVDAGTDSVSSARADIKQNIDNVNDIIDHINISSPSDGQVLQYSSSSGKWEQVTAATIGGSSKRTVFYPSAGIVKGDSTANEYVADWETEADGGAVLSVTENVDSAGGHVDAPNSNITSISDSAGLFWHFTVDAGFYEFYYAGNWPTVGAGTGLTWGLYNLDTDVSTTHYLNNGSDNDFNKSDYEYFSGTTRLTVYYKAPASQGPIDTLFTGGQNQNWRFIVVKHS